MAITGILIEVGNYTVSLVQINLVSLIGLIEYFYSILLAPFRDRPISDIVGLITSLIVPSHILTHFKVTCHPRSESESLLAPFVIHAGAVTVGIVTKPQPMIWVPFPHLDNKILFNIL